MDLGLKGKTAIITGGSRGIGKAVAREFGREGVEVALVSRGIEQLEATAKELAAETGGRYIPIAADTSNEGSIKTMVQRAVQELGHLDILVNGAARVGGSRPAPNLSEITEEDFWDDMQTKVLGYLMCAREVAPYMASQGWGRIINISGLAARQSGTIIGSMRNVSVAAMTKNLADQLGPQGINVTVVHPGLTRTERTAALVEAQMSSQGITAEEAEKRMAANISIGRMIDQTIWQEIVAATVSRFGNLDVLVKNAGVGGTSKVEETSEAEWDRVMAINAKGVFLGTQAAIPEMRSAGGGSAPSGNQLRCGKGYGGTLGVIGS